MGAIDYFEADKYTIDLYNAERKYFALDEIESTWETKVYFSSTYDYHKRTTIFFDGDLIKKVIYETLHIKENDEIGWKTYKEYDTLLQTREKEFILPLTIRGKEKKLTPTNVMAVTPLGCSLYFSFKGGPIDETRLFVTNYRNNQELPLPEPSKIMAISSKEEFREFVEWFIKTCPPNYMDKVNRVRNLEHQTIKYRVGDIFRVEYNREKYCYGLIIGKISDIEKWEECKKTHSFHSLMLQPILVRMYDLITQDSDMKASDLKDMPLLQLDICSDSELYWGTYPIVEHKELVEKDICFRFLYKKERRQGTRDYYDLIIEWGLAHVIVPYEKFTKEVKDIVENLDSQSAGVGLNITIGIVDWKEEDLPKYWKMDLQLTCNNDLRQKLLECIGIDKDISFDDFANAFGGITKQEFVRRQNEKR